MNAFEPRPLYAGYAYAYPHKTAYRALKPPVALRDVWAAERRDALFLYLHTPFCEMRCGFCNLFTTANPPPGFAQDYLAALRRQAARTREALGPATFARLAVGGGTPTYLDEASLESLFDVAERTFGVDPQNIPVSVETSPLTAETGKLRLLRERGVDRISIGVQSFIEAEVKAVGRSQKTAVVEQALDRIRNVGFPTLNIDLIYGLPGQTTGSWLESLRAALRFKPEELYLYPLYVRPMTGLGRRSQKAEDDLRPACYRAGRELLLESGYRQISMRMFQAAQAPTADGRSARPASGISSPPISPKPPAWLIRNTPSISLTTASGWTARNNAAASPFNPCCKSKVWNSPPIARASARKRWMICRNSLGLKITAWRRAMTPVCD